MPVPHLRVMSQINCGDITMLSQIQIEILSLATMAEWVINDLFLAELCVQDMK